MAKARAIVKRRKSVQNIRKITRTMELIATARFKKALDRATAAEAYTRKIAELVADLAATAGEVSHPLLEVREPAKKSLLLVLTSNRGLAGGYNGNVIRVASRTLQDYQTDRLETRLEVSGKRGIAFCRFRKIPFDASYLQFEDRPQFAEVEAHQALPRPLTPEDTAALVAMLAGDDAAALTGQTLTVDGGLVLR